MALLCRHHCASSQKLCALIFEKQIVFLCANDENRTNTEIRHCERVLDKPLLAHLGWQKLLMSAPTASKSGNLSSKPGNSCW